MGCDGSRRKKRELFRAYLHTEYSRTSGKNKQKRNSLRVFYVKKISRKPNRF